MSTIYRRARFVTAAPTPAEAPPDNMLEVAFAGRSNAGKSSALNSICGRRSLAKTSKAPGRTRLLMFFALDERRMLVDLPGYGYAQVAAPVKRQWAAAVESYLARRKSLRGLILLMDIRHPLTPGDWLMLEWCRHAGLPVHLMLTKSDKLKFGAVQRALSAVRRSLAEAGVEAGVQAFSALKQSGLEEVYAVLDGWLEVEERQNT